MKKIYCIMSDCIGDIASLGCYPSREEAETALAYWDAGDYSYQWIVEHELYKDFKETLRNLEKG